MCCHSLLHRYTTCDQVRGRFQLQVLPAEATRLVPEDKHKLDNLFASNTSMRDSRNRLLVNQVKLLAEDGLGGRGVIPAGCEVCCRIEFPDPSATSPSAIASVVEELPRLEGCDINGVLHGELFAMRDGALFRCLELQQDQGRGDGMLNLVFFVDGGAADSSVILRIPFKFTTDQVLADRAREITEMLVTISDHIYDYYAQVQRHKSDFRDIKIDIRRLTAAAPKGELRYSC